MSKKKYVAALYLRLSKEDGDKEESYSIANQRALAVDYLKNQKGKVVCLNDTENENDFELHKKLVPMQAGDVPITYADTSALEEDFGFKPNTSLRDGLRAFSKWYKEFYM